MSTLYELLNNNKFSISCIPIINYIIYIIYTLAISIPNGIIDLESAKIILPCIIIGMLMIYLFLKIFGDSILAIIILLLIAFISIIYTVYSMVTYKLKKKTVNVTTAREIATIERTTIDITTIDKTN